ncbi:amino acid/amide ABC transporter ATP-binding protein 2 (HAAT family) [Fluviicoccus keumensis]|uniref:High-affinity branched-chain amino acid transport ATP-binding protein n=1 Tax=Fluviicoccus keumensis TaxID=1435465 RepID=A0A4Q7Z8H1_9GAMM|nr:ABC transporter ATP-binding protein [Fluviicoccus keumensis]RZU46807.1 amino acid/amide ABC transporter ATP-binding protein 2 (HAAT family) [Fluviicoccus keumensis]
MTLLKISGLQVAYGGIQAVKGIDLEVHPGELVCLIGANGAGKTTTLHCLGGLLKPSGGSIHYQGKDMLAVQAHDRVRLGLSLVPEGRGVFSRLTVAENLQMGAYARKLQPGELEKAFERFPRLHERRDQLAGTLSGGEQQMLAIVRALLSKPKLLLLDEPSMGLAPLMVEKIFATIAEVTADGVAVLLVEQNARAALKLAQRAYVMESGRITLEGPAAELAADARVRAAYLGE